MLSGVTSYSQKEGIMKIHNDFTLYWRVVPSGKRVVYYYAYDEDGKRLGGWSTGEAAMTAARVRCNRLLQEGKLVPHTGFMPTFEEYSRGWWEWETCAYLKKRRKRRALTQSYAANAKKNLKNILVPYFGSMPLNKITKDEIEEWFDDLSDRDFQNTSINGYFATLQTMLNEAVERKIIAVSPTKKVSRLVNDRRNIKIITRLEFKKLFVEDWERVWDNNRLSYLANKLAAVTGMRASEVLGLKGGYVYEDHIYLCKQFDEYGYRPTKTKDQHNIPLPARMIAELNELKAMNGDGFVFSDDGGAVPISRGSMYHEYHKALRNIGICKEEISERHLHLHGWRHFFNTELLKGGLSVPQAQAITGHKTERMTEWYSHFNPMEFSQARNVQEGLLLVHDDEPEASRLSQGTVSETVSDEGAAVVKNKPDWPDLKIVKMPEREDKPTRKQA
jgi:integrase